MGVHCLIKLLIFHGSLTLLLVLNLGQQKKNEKKKEKKKLSHSHMN